MKLYHGSSENIKDEYLTPNLPFKNSFENIPSVYFSDKFEIALLYSINPIRIYIKNHQLKDNANAFSSYFKFDIKKNKIVLYECYKGMLNEVYNNTSYIYTVDVSIDKMHKDISGYNTNSHIKYNEKLKVDNVLAELLKLETENKIEIIRFDDLTYKDKNNLYNSISCRANGCETNAEILFFKEKFCDINEVQKYLKLND